MPMLPLVLAAVAVALPLERYSVSGDGPALAVELGGAGFDVVEGSIEPHALQVVVTPGERALLHARGLPMRRLAVGRPLDQGASVAGGYPDLASVEAALSACELEYPDICAVVDLTDWLGVDPTEEGRHQYAVHISDAPDVLEDEPGFFLVGNHHARELVTPLASLAVMERLTEGYGVDPEVTGAVDGWSIWIAPVWNPDGYTAVFEVDNLWRKNRRVFADGIGVDLNRNYPTGWSGECGGSDEVADNTYRGPSAASEAETRAAMGLAELVHLPSILDLHSYGQEVVYGSPCLEHPFGDYVMQEAIALSFAAGYGGEARLASADGEHFEWHQLDRGSYAFLLEIAQDFQPPLPAAEAEAERVWSATRWMLARPFALSGHVLDACTEAPIGATLTLASDEGSMVIEPSVQHGRFDLMVPDGTYEVWAEAADRLPVSETVDVEAGVTAVVELRMAVEEVCDGLDTDCDGVLPEDEQDRDGDGMAACQGDCADDDASSFAGAEELCDGIDNDCDGAVDEQACDTGPGALDTADTGGGEPTTPSGDSAHATLVGSGCGCAGSGPVGPAWLWMGLFVLGRRGAGRPR